MARASQRFLAVFKDWTGQYTQSNAGLGLMESLDGTTWAMAADPGVSLGELRWADGTVTSLMNLERPHIYFGECGRPTVLYAAAAEGDVFNAGAPTFAVQIPLVGGCP